MASFIWQIESICIESELGTIRVIVHVVILFNDDLLEIDVTSYRNDFKQLNFIIKYIDMVLLPYYLIKLRQSIKCKILPYFIIDILENLLCKIFCTL